MATYRFSIDYVIDVDDQQARSDILAFPIANIDTGQVDFEAQTGMSQQPVEDLISIALMSGGAARLAEMVPSAQIISERRRSISRES